MFRFEAKYDCLKRHAVALQFIGYQFLRVFFAASGGRKRASWQGDRNVIERGGGVCVCGNIIYLLTIFAAIADGRQLLTSTEVVA